MMIVKRKRIVYTLWNHRHFSFCNLTNRGPIEKNMKQVFANLYQQKKEKKCSLYSKDTELLWARQNLFTATIKFSHEFFLIWGSWDMWKYCEIITLVLSDMFAVNKNSRNLLSMWCWVTTIKCQDIKNMYDWRIHCVCSLRCALL